MLSAAAIGAALVAGLLAYAATRPGTFHVERTIGIQAPPDRIFAFLNDFAQWSRWSPYEKLDPAMRRTRSGPASGKGAVYAWNGNRKAGAGRMEILQSVAPWSMVAKLDFSRPFEAHNTVRFTLATEGGSTRVTWSMEGPQAYAFKLMTVFFSMDAMLGKEFETGLCNLKTVAEQPPLDRLEHTPEHKGTDTPDAASQESLPNFR